MLILKTFRMNNVKRAINLDSSLVIQRLNIFSLFQQSKKEAYIYLEIASLQFILLISLVLLFLLFLLCSLLQTHF